MDVLTALAAGILAGLGVAAPLGAVGILLLREGLAAGFRNAAPAAAAVAVVDAVYCILAVSAGQAAGPLIISWGALPAVAGGLTLLVLGLVGIRRTLRSSPGAAPEAGPVPASSSGFSKRRRFAFFLALTAINPITLLYFAALAAGLRGLLSSAAGPAAFVTGVALGSLAWQLGLVLAGALLRGRITAAAQRAASLAGYATIAVLGTASVTAALLEPR